MANLTAEVISIGDEITSGSRLDTNSQWLSRRLGEIGIEVLFHTTVGDTLEHNVNAFRNACDRVDVVVASGGLGPTRDDLTREVLALVSGQSLELRPEILDQIRGMFTRRGREMPARNDVQAMFPVGSNVIANPHGTAPGIDVLVPRSQGGVSRVFALPGVPSEMKQMFDETVAGELLRRNGGNAHLRHRVMKFFGTGESDMEQRLGEMIARNRVPRVGITVSAATISLRITAMGDSVEMCEEMIEATRAEILQRVGDLYFGEGESFEQHHAIDQALRDASESLVLVELGYAAPLGDWFAAMGDTPTYRGGLSLAEVEHLLALADATTLRDAMGSLKRRFKADWVLVVDRYPELLDVTVAQPPTSFKVEVLTPSDEHFTSEHTIVGHPDILHARMAKTAESWLRQLIARRVAFAK